MNNKLLLIGLLILPTLLILIACQGETSSEVGDTQTLNLVVATHQVSKDINLVTLADLDQTFQIKVLRREDGNDSTSAYFEELFTITDKETIRAVVVALDRDLNLRPSADCPALYTLIFHLPDGRHHEYGYACEMASPSFLRGGQLFWQGQDVLAPDAFNRAFSEKLYEASLMETPFHE
jgi:hypothetical protein